MDAKIISSLNDDFRSKMLNIDVSNITDNIFGGKLFITRGISDLLSKVGLLILFKEVGEFNKFDEDNDPYGEHDFGKIDIGDMSFFWKIDYYDLSMDKGSEDPSDPSQTTRVLTIMLEDEY